MKDLKETVTEISETFLFTVAVKKQQGEFFFLLTVVREGPRRSALPKILEPALLIPETVYVMMW